MDIEIRLLLVIHAFACLSGLPLAYCADLSLQLARQLLHSTAAASGLDPRSIGARLTAGPWRSFANAPLPPPKNHVDPGPTNTTPMRPFPRRTPANLIPRQCCILRHQRLAKRWRGQQPDARRSREPSRYEHGPFSGSRHPHQCRHDQWRQELPDHVT